MEAVRKDVEEGSEEVMEEQVVIACREHVDIVDEAVFWEKYKRA